MKAQVEDYNEVLVENNFGSLLSRPGRDPRLNWHADIFRDGAVPDLGLLVSGIADEIENRSLASPNYQVRLAVVQAVERLREIGAFMQCQPEDDKESMGYHWEIVGELLAVIAAVLSARHTLTATAPDRPE